jgi:hypothetical protein
MRNILILVGVLFTLFFSSPVVFAQSTADCGANCNLKYTPLEPLPGGFSALEGKDINLYLSAYITSGFKLLILLGGLTAVVMLIIGGMSYMFSEVSPENKSKAKKRIIGAIWGLTLLLFSYLILNTINPQLVNFTTIFSPTAGINGGTQPGVVAGGTGGAQGAPGACTATGPGTCQDTLCRATQTVNANGSAGCTLDMSITGTWECYCG